MDQGLQHIQVANDSRARRVSGQPAEVRRQCSRKRGQPLKKRKKSCFLDFEKKKRKKRKKTYVVSKATLITQPLITQLPEVR